MRGTMHQEGVHVQIEGEGLPQCGSRLLWINHGGMGANWTTVNEIYYRKVTREQICKKRPDL